MARTKRLIAAVVTMLALGVAPLAAAADGAATSVTPAAKQDSGLGELSAYRDWNEPWLYSTPAASVDDGLGALSPASLATELWMFSHPAAKMDNGLGEVGPAATMRAAQAHAGFTPVAF